MNITDFLLARIEEDEKRAKYYGLALGTERVLAECKAKRAIVHYCSGLGVDKYQDAEVDAQYRAARWIAGQFAKVYADHPDYQQEWAL